MTSKRIGNGSRLAVYRLDFDGDWRRFGNTLLPDCTPLPKSSDLDGDCSVGILDLLAMLAGWS